MGVARLLAKGWVVFCFYAGAQAFYLGLIHGTPPLDVARGVAICVLLFGAMGLLFIAGFGISSGGGTAMLPARMAPRHFLPSFNAVVFLAFVVLVFAAQIWFEIGNSSAGLALQNAMFFVVPGEFALTRRLLACRYPQTYNYPVTLSSAFAWLLAIIYVASAVSRIGLTAGLLRLEQSRRPSSSFSPTVLAALYGIVAIAGFQLLYVGSVYAWLDCHAFVGVTGGLMIGLAPLMLAYLIVAALVMLKASGPEA